MATTDGHDIDEMLGRATARVNHSSRNSPDTAQAARLAAAAASALRLSHPAEPAALRWIRRQIEEWAQRNAVPDAELLDLQLAIGEAAANGVEHAYCGTQPGVVDIDVEIRGAARGRRVLVRVVDHGRWRPIPLVNGFRGRGLTMIERLAQRVRVYRHRCGTEVCFEIPLPT